MTTDGYEGLVCDDGSWRRSIRKSFSVCKVFACFFRDGISAREHLPKDSRLRSHIFLMRPFAQSTTTTPATSSMSRRSLCDESTLRPAP